MSRASEGARWPLGGGTQRAVSAVLVVLLAVLLITGYFFVQSLRLEQAQTLAESDAIARGVAAFIEAREGGYDLRDPDSASKFVAVTLVGFPRLER